MSVNDRFSSNHGWITAYANAQGALERMAERRRLSPVRHPWRIRALVAERLALARIDGSAAREVDYAIDGRGAVSPSPFDLTRWRSAVGARIGLDALTGDGTALLDWLGYTSQRHFDQARPTADVLDAIDAWRQAIDGLPPSPPLIHSARLAWHWHRVAPIGQGDLIAGLLIGDRWGPGRWGVSFGGLVALGLNDATMSWKGVTAERFELAWLDAIRAGAHVHLDLEMRLRSYAKRAAYQLAQRRRPGRLKDVLLMAMSHPRLTSGQVAKALDLTSAGAIKLLTIAAGEGLLIEQSGQASYRSYALPVNMQHRPTTRDALDDILDAEFWASGENEGPSEPR